MKKRTALAAALLVASHALAQTVSDSIAQYRALLADGNPAELWEAKGEALWKSPRGPKSASLQQCDLAKSRQVQMQPSYWNRIPSVASSGKPT